MGDSILPVILCGGPGSRLWPLSTPARPKPFHSLDGGDTLLQATARRLAPSPASPFLAPVVICAQAHAARARAELRRMGVRPALVIAEPRPGGTALAAALAVKAAAEIAPGAQVLIVPADHQIDDPQGLRTAMRAARRRIVLFSARPDRPETGYGYVRAGRPLAGGAHSVEAFREKPSAAEARALVEQGAWGWNMGLFLAAPEVLEAEIARHAPDTAARAGAAWARARRRGSAMTLAEGPEQPAPSLDRAVIERSGRLAVMACDVGWRDLGCWNALWSAGGRDAARNQIKGPAMAVESSGCLVWASDLPVTVIGMADVVVVSTSSGVLVMPRGRAQELGAVAARAIRPPAAVGARPFNSTTDELLCGDHPGAAHDLRRTPLDL